MIIRKLDTNHDWTFGHGLSNYAKDEEAINENIQTRLLSWVNDCFFNLQDGIDWRNRLEVGQQKELKEEINANILQSFGVIGINFSELIFNGVTRVASMTYNVQTIFSPSFQSTINQDSGSTVNA
jgi:hypothetical protein